VEVVAAPLGAKGGEILDLKIPGLFEIVIISDEVRVFLSKGRRQKTNEE
jgi:hypothetical protein